MLPSSGDWRAAARQRSKHRRRVWARRRRPRRAVPHGGWRGVVAAGAGGAEAAAAAARQRASLVSLAQRNNGMPGRKHCFCSLNSCASRVVLCSNEARTLAARACATANRRLGQRVPLVLPAVTLARQAPPRRGPGRPRRRNRRNRRRHAHRQQRRCCSSSGAPLRPRRLPTLQQQHQQQQQEVEGLGGAAGSTEEGGSSPLLRLSQRLGSFLRLHLPAAVRLPTRQASAGTAQAGRQAPPAPRTPRAQVLLLQGQTPVHLAACQGTSPWPPMPTW